MPIYVYEREDGSSFETIQKMSDAPLTVCPDTGQKVVKKISSSTPIFKGSGFYQTDYGTGSSSKNSSATAKVESKPTEASTTKSDSTTPSATKKCGTGCGCH